MTPEVGRLGDGLTVKQRRFCEEYLVDFNATQAAIRAGYSENSARSIGSENLTKPDIANAIGRLLNELTMSSAEAAMRLTRWGRGSLAPFVRITVDGDAVVDLATAEAQAAIDLVKKLRQTEQTVRGKDGAQYTTVRTEIELHDAKDAVVQMARLHGLFREVSPSDDDGPITSDEVEDLFAAFDRVRSIREFEQLLVESATGRG